MFSTFSTSTANCSVLRQLRSVCTTTLAMLRWTKTSPGIRPVIWLAGTRESEQPIHRYLGAWMRERRSKKVGSSALTFAAQSLFLSSSSFRGMASVQAEGDASRLGEEAHGLPAAFATQSGLLHAAEGRAQVAVEPGVDPDDARLQAGGQAVGAAQVGGPEPGGRAVGHRIGQGQGLGLVLEGLQADRRAEDFLGIGAAVLAQALDHGRGDEPAAGAAAFQPERLAAAEDAAALGAGGVDAAQDLFVMRLRDQRTQLAVRRQRIAGDQGAHLFQEGLAEFLVVAALDQDARAAQADLPAVEEGRAHHRIQQLRPRRVGEDDGRVLATQLQRDLAQARGAGFRDG